MRSNFLEASIFWECETQHCIGVEMIQGYTTNVSTLVLLSFDVATNIILCEYSIPWLMCSIFNYTTFWILNEEPFWLNSRSNTHEQCLISTFENSKHENCEKAFISEILWYPYNLYYMSHFPRKIPIQNRTLNKNN